MLVEALKHRRAEKRAAKETSQRNWQEWVERVNNFPITPLTLKQHERQTGNKFFPILDRQGKPIEIHDTYWGPNYVRGIAQEAIVLGADAIVSLRRVDSDIGREMRGFTHIEYGTPVILRKTPPKLKI